MEDTGGVVKLGMPYNQRPDQKNLHRFIADYCKHWRGIGLQLGLKSCVISQVEADHHELSERFRVTLDKWLELNVGVTWESLEFAITNANRMNLGLQPLPTTTVSESHSEVAESDDKKVREDDEKLRKDDKRSQAESINGTPVTKHFRNFVINKMRKAFSDVVGELINIFEEQKINIKKLITVLSFDDVNKTSVFSTDDAFSKIQTGIELIHHVSQYCKSIYDYRVLDVLVGASECPEAIEKLNNFTELLQSSVLTEIDLMSEHGELLHPDDFMPGTYKFIIEYVGGKCSIETKEMIQNIVEQSVRLKKGVLVFKGIDVGSILFIYQISEAVKIYLFQYMFTISDLTFLEENNIASLRVDGITIMCSSQLYEGYKQMQIKINRLKAENQIAKESTSIDSGYYSKEVFSLSTDYHSSSTIILTSQLPSLHFAAQHGDSLSVKSLIKHGVDLNAVNEDHCTPLHLATQNGHDAIVEILIECGADVNARNKDQWTLLHVAAQNGHDSVVECLIKCGAEVNAVEVNQQTPLHLAALNGHNSAIENLIKCGAKVNAVNVDQGTPLHLAAHNGHDSSVECLVNCGAEVNAVEMNKQTPLHVAAQNSHNL